MSPCDLQSLQAARAYVQAAAGLLGICLGQARPEAAAANMVRLAQFAAVLEELPCDADEPVAEPFRP